MFDGNGEKTNWWTKSSTAAFVKRSSCMIKQYSNYTMYGEKVAKPDLILLSIVTTADHDYLLNR